MLLSIALIILLGLSFGSLFTKLKLPSLLGMIIVGIILSPYALNLIDKSILDISSDLREIALIIILTRAGLSLDITELKKVGRPAILMCFVPACLEIIGVMVFAPKLLGVNLLEAAIIGCVIAAVSPAILVPRMITLIENGYGLKHSIPQLILAGTAVDDIFVIVIFTSLISLDSTGVLSFSSFLDIPISIITGILLGILVGILLVKLFKKFHIRDSVKILIIFSLSILFVELENMLENIIPLSGLIGIMTLGIIIKEKYEELSVRLSSKYNKIWILAEIFLFVLVGSIVDLRVVISSGYYTILVILGALVFRMVGVAISLIKTKLTRKEKLFCMIAYTPKATVQAAIGAIPLSMGLACGEAVLMVAVISILITAPLGAVCIDNLYPKLLDK